jgi:hypothetical protein
MEGDSAKTAGDEPPGSTVLTTPRSVERFSHVVAPAVKKEKGLKALLRWWTVRQKNKKRFRTILETPPVSIREAQVQFCSSNRFRRARAIIASVDEQPEAILLAIKKWRLTDPQLLIDVTGSDGFDGPMPFARGLAEKLKRGIAVVARSTPTWIFTGGLDGGVVQFAGEAIAGDLGIGACIGVASYRRVRDVGRFGAYTAYGLRDPEPPATADGTGRAALEKNHTHFLLVDDDAEDATSRRASQVATLANCIKDDLCTSHQVPIVTIVLGGAIHNLDDVYVPDRRSPTHCRAPLSHTLSRLQRSASRTR